MKCHRMVQSFLFFFSALDAQSVGWCDTQMPPSDEELISALGRLSGALSPWGAADVTAGVTRQGPSNCPRSRLLASVCSPFSSASLITVLRHHVLLLYKYGILRFWCSKTPLEVWTDLVFTAEQIRGCCLERDWWKVRESAVILNNRDKNTKRIKSYPFDHKTVLCCYPPFVQRRGLLKILSNNHLTGFTWDRLRVITWRLHEIIFNLLPSDTTKAYTFWDLW